MQYINNNSDFALDIALKAILPDGAELATAPPNCDFTLTFGTRYDEAKYEVGRYNGEPRGYTVNTDGSLHVIFDAHGLGLGRLGCMLTYGIPDSSYPDGVATVATSYELDVELIGWGADGQQSGTVTIATEAAAVSAAQQAQAAAEQAAGQVTSAVDTANEAKTMAQQAEAKAETAVAVSNDSKAQAEAAVQAAEASRQAAEQSAAQATQAQQAATAAAGEAAQSAEAVQQSATAAAQSAEKATQAAISAAQAVERADSAIATANAATESATAAAQAAAQAATNANTAADNASQYVDRYEDIANSLPIVIPDFEGAENDKGLRYVIRKNKLIAILKDGHVEYAPEGLAYVDAIEPTSFTIGATTYNVPAGVSYVELGLDTAQKSLQQVFYEATLRSVHFVLDTSKVTNFHDFFAFCSNLEKVDLSSIDTSSATQLYDLFYECKSLKEVDLSGFNTSKCLSFGNMFWGCKSLQSLDVSNFDTSKATSLAGMFANLQISEIDVSNFRTENVINLSYMFAGCANLLTLDLSSFQTPVNKRLDFTLNGCTNLKFVDVSSLDTSQVISFKQTFWGCESLQRLDLSSFELGAATEVNGMFVNDIALTTLKFPNMGMLKADTDYNKSIDLSYSPLDKASLDSIFTYDRTANGLTNPLTVQLSKASKALLSAEDIAAITAKGYTIV